MLTLDQAFAELSKLTASGPTTTQQLMELAAQVSLDTAPGSTQGSVTLLYSGEINGVRSSEYIKKMIDQGEDIRVIDKTNVGKFLADLEFNKAWQAAGGTSAMMRDGLNGPWAKASGRFVADTVGEVRLLGFSPDSTSVFVMTELKKALADGSRITSIEGISITDLRKMSFNEVLKSVTTASVEHVGYGGFMLKAADVIGADGNVVPDWKGKPQRTIVSLNVGEFLNRDILDTQTYLKNHPSAAQSFRDFWKNGITADEAGTVKAGARGVAKRLGVIGSALGLGIAFSESDKASENEDTEKARQIMDAWAIDAAGSTAGAAIGSTVVAIAAGAAVAAGAVISAPVLAALAIGGAIVGGIYGSKAATDAWAEYRGSADATELNLLEKLSAYVALPDFHLVFGTKDRGIKGVSIAILSEPSCHVAHALN